MPRLLRRYDVAVGVLLFKFVLKLFHVDYLAKLREQFRRDGCLIDGWSLRRRSRQADCSERIRIQDESANTRLQPMVRT